MVCKVCDGHKYEDINHYKSGIWDIQINFLEMKWEWDHVWNSIGMPYRARVAEILSL